MKSRVRASAVVVHQGKLLAIKAKDPKSGQDFVFLPGGAVEPEETAVEAASRETLEETGFKISVDPLSCVDKEYIFHWNGEDYDCLTLFYRGFLSSPIAGPVTNEPEYNIGTVWIPVTEISKHFAYTSEVLEAIQQLT